MSVRSKLSTPVWRKGHFVWFPTVLPVIHAVVDVLYNVLWTYMCWQLHFPVDFSALKWCTSQFIYMYCASWLNTYDCCACVLTLGCGWKCRAVNVCIVQCTFMLCCHCLHSCRMGTLHSWWQPTGDVKILWRSFSHQGLPLSALIMWAHVLYRVHIVA